jgi:hypothetical protein
MASKLIAKLASKLHPTLADRKPSVTGRLPWSPLGVGFLTGATDERTRLAEGDICGIESRWSAPTEVCTDNLPRGRVVRKGADCGRFNRGAFYYGCSSGRSSMAR